MSFAFTIAPDGETREMTDGGRQVTVREVGQLFHDSVVTQPAYTQTNPTMRSRDAEALSARQKRKDSPVKQAEASLATARDRMPRNERRDAAPHRWRTEGDRPPRDDRRRGTPAGAGNQAANGRGVLEQAVARH
jgi:hypothetical protein